MEEENTIWKALYELLEIFQEIERESNETQNTK